MLRSQGCLVYPLVAGRGIPAGWPDVLVWHCSWDGLIELKGLNTPTEPAQQEKLRQLYVVRPRCAVSYRLVPDARAGFWGRIYYYDPDCKGALDRSVRPEDLLHALSQWRSELKS